MEHRPVDFDETAIQAALSELPLGGLRVFRRIGSTNDEALAWASEGAADFSLVVADEQKGLAVGFSNFYHDSKLKTMKLKGIPGVESVPSYQGVFNMPAIHFFKIKKGKIYDIEATGLVLPYGTKSGWE